MKKDLLIIGVVILVVGAILAAYGFIIQEESPGKDAKTPEQMANDYDEDFEEYLSYNVGETVWVKGEITNKTSALGYDYRLDYKWNFISTEDIGDIGDTVTVECELSVDSKTWVAKSLYEGPLGSDNGISVILIIGIIILVVGLILTIIGVIFKPKRRSAHRPPPQPEYGGRPTYNRQAQPPSEPYDEYQDWSSAKKRRDHDYYEYETSPPQKTHKRHYHERDAYSEEYYDRPRKRKQQRKRDRERDYYEPEPSHPPPRAQPPPPPPQRRHERDYEAYDDSGDYVEEDYRYERRARKIPRQQREYDYYENEHRRAPPPPPARNRDSGYGYNEPPRQARRQQYDYYEHRRAPQQEQYSDEYYERPRGRRPRY